MTDDDLLALCCYKEAWGEPSDGIAAVALVVFNRMAQRYASDGTVYGTVTRRAQFSWVNYDFVKGRYVCVATTPEAVDARLAALLSEAKNFMHAFGLCEDISQSVKNGEWSGGAAYQKLGSKALLYDNLAISHPVWATPDKFIAEIGHHSFYAS